MELGPRERLRSESAIKWVFFVFGLFHIMRDHAVIARP